MLHGHAASRYPSVCLFKKRQDLALLKPRLLHAQATVVKYCRTKEKFRGTSVLIYLETTGLPSVQVYKRQTRKPILVMAVFEYADLTSTNTLPGCSFDSRSLMVMC